MYDTIKEAIKYYKEDVKSREYIVIFFEHFLNSSDEMYNLFEDDVEKFIEKLQSSDIEEFFNNHFNDISDYEKVLQYIFYNEPSILTNLFDIEIYNYYIQLTDRRVLWEIEKEIDIDTYKIIVNDEIKNIKKELNKKFSLNINELALLGRGGRHLVIYNKNNYSDFNYEIFIKNRNEIYQFVKTYINDFIKRINGKGNE